MFLNVSCSQLAKLYRACLDSTDRKTRALAPYIKEVLSKRDGVNCSKDCYRCYFSASITDSKGNNKSCLNTVPRWCE